MSTLVMKFGGASVAQHGDFSHIADLIAARKAYFQKVLVVVSAMGDTTDQLLDLARQVNPNPPKRELDMLVTVGERISASLLAMALWNKGVEAISFTGSQAGIITSDAHADARIIDVRPWRLEKNLEEGKVIIVAGFQGVSQKGEVTTLGRGGSDTTAVALGCAFRAEKVEFFKDVLGIYPKNPKTEPAQAPFEQLNYQEALQIVRQTGSEILHPRCIELAERNGLRLHVLSFKNYSANKAGTWIMDGSFDLQQVIYETS